MATARGAAERRRQKCSPPGPARERRDSDSAAAVGSGVELRRAPPGAGRASWRPPAAQRSGGGRSAAHRAWPGDSTGRRSPCIIQRRLPGEASGSCGLGAGAATLACGAGAGGLAAPTGRVVSITVESPAEEAASATSAGEVHGDDTCEADKLRLRRAARGSRRW